MASSCSPGPGCSSDHRRPSRVPAVRSRSRLVEVLNPLHTLAPADAASASPAASCSSRLPVLAAAAPCSPARSPACARSSPRRGAARPCGLTSPPPARRGASRCRRTRPRAARRAGSAAAPASSLEFIEFRDYVPGDDLRHLDWRAYARTDALQVRLFREEVAPHLDVVLDLTASMATTPAKAAPRATSPTRSRRCAERTGSRARRLVAGGRVARRRRARSPRSRARDAGALVPRAPLRPRGSARWSSDFLVARRPGAAAARARRGRRAPDVVQVLDPWEVEPDADGAWTLEDAEDGARLDLDLGPGAVEGYRRRLGRLREDVARATRALGGTYALVPAAALPEMLRASLAPQGVVEPA